MGMLDEGLLSVVNKNVKDTFRHSQTFNTTGTFTPETHVKNVDVVIVGAGGDGGDSDASYGGGGGGAGQVIYLQGIPVNGAIPVTVGVAGSGDGGYSSFGQLISSGGKAGADASGSDGAGGDGGGGYNTTSGGGYTGGATIGGDGTSVSFTDVIDSSTVQYLQQGAGGAAGGGGILDKLGGSSLHFAGGSGGTGNNGGGGGAGGFGGAGGDGGNAGSNGENAGGVGAGGGGAGDGSNTGGTGGNGVVIVKWRAATD